MTNSPSHPAPGSAPSPGRLISGETSAPLREAAGALAIDVQAIQGPSAKRGLGRYVWDLTDALLAMDGDEWSRSLVISPNAPVPPGFAELASRADSVAHLPLPPVPFSELGSRVLAESYQRLEVFVEACLVGSPFEGFHDTRTATPNSAVAWADTTAAIVYDLIPMLFPSAYFAHRPDYERWYLDKLRLISGAQQLLAISQATADDLVRVLGVDPALITVIGAGTGSAFGTSDKNAGQPSSAADAGRYFISVYQSDWRKNQQVIFEAFSLLPLRLRNWIKLVLVTSDDPETMGELGEYARRTGIDPDSFVVTGYIGDDELSGLYANALALLFPSVYEGFGLPALEAIRSGCLAITSDTPALVEVCGTPDTTFGPRDPRALATLMGRALDDEGWRRESHARQLAASARFTWENAALRAMSAIANL